MAARGTSQARYAPVVVGVAVAAAISTVMAIGTTAARAATSTTKVSVTVSAVRSGTAGSGFAGFSYEKDRIGAGVFDADDTNLVHLFRLLGPSVLRIGGSLVDIVNWNPSGSGGSANEIAPADVDNLAGFVNATGWHVIYGINLKKNTTSNAASEAQYVAKALGSHLLAFEIGNEPNTYLSEAAYEADFEAYVSAIRAKVPSAAFDGPGEADSTGWASSFAAKEKSRLTILSTHGYVSSNTNASIPGMLASTSSGRFASWISAMSSAASANGISQWRFTEANSYFHGGADGVSNVKAAALWSLDLMRETAARGGAGLNFHGGTSVQFPLYYTPITFNDITPTGVQGVYYGELLWHLAGTGTFHAATVSGGAGVTAWGIGNNVVVDNEGDATLTTSITLQALASSAKLYTLTGHALNSPQITIAGSAVSVSGGFTPKPTSVRISSGTKAAISVPPHSAALLVTS